MIALLLVNTLETALLQGRLPGQLLSPLLTVVVQLLSFVAAALLFRLTHSAQSRAALKLAPPLPEFKWLDRRE